MVKKINSRGSAGKAKGTSPVQSTKTVGTKGVDSVSGVAGAEKASEAAVVQGGSTEITPDMRDEMFQLIDEVAESMFKTGGAASERKRRTIKQAVKLAIDAGLIKEE